MSLSVTAISYASETNEDKTVVGTTNISDSQTLQPENTAVTYTWKVESKKKIGEETGKWKTVHQKEIKKADAPGTVKYSYTKSYKHSFSGSLEVSYKVLTAALGFDVRSSESETVNFIKKMLQPEPGTVSFAQCTINIRLYRDNIEWEPAVRERQWMKQKR